MLKQMNKIIQSAKAQLPAAFSDTLRPPWHETEEAVAPYNTLEWPKDRMPDSYTHFGPETATREELDEFDEEVRERGTDTLAYYISFHSPLLNGRWGVFIIEQAFWLLRERIRNDLHLAPYLAELLAQNIVLAHEFYHFKFDLYTLHQELILHQPLYLTYNDLVYRNVYCTSACYEESLANHKTVEEAKNERRKNSKSIVPPFPLSTIARWPSYVRHFCDLQPPGYRDFNRPVSELKEGLGGQLHFLKSSQPLSQPQAQWVDLCPWRSPQCHIFYIKSSTLSKKGLRLTTKVGGNIWISHRYDKDTWPSQPHGHKETKGKLHMGTGEVYDPVSRRCSGKIPRKHLLQIRDELSIKWPDILLPPLD